MDEELTSLFTIHSVLAKILHGNAGTISSCLVPGTISLCSLLPNAPFLGNFLSLIARKK